MRPCLNEAINSIHSEKTSGHVKKEMLKSQKTGDVKKSKDIDGV